MLVKYLTSEGYEVATASSAREGERLFLASPFDLLVVDRMMSGQDGADWLADLRARGIATPAILLTAVGDSDSRIEGLTKGADDYLPKPFDPRELGLRIAKILKRSSPAPDVSGLTDVEERVLSLLKSRSGAPVSREEIAKLLRSGERSVDVAIYRLRSKLGDNSRSPRIILTCRGIGYKMPA